MKLKDSFHPYALITVIFWSFSYVLTRLTLQYFSAFSLGLLRYLAASCTLIVIMFFIKIKMPAKADWLSFLAAGAFGFFLYMITFNKGHETVTASTGSVIIATVPVITALLARFVYHEKLTGFQWAAIGIEFLGVLVLTLMNGVFSLNAGVLWLILAALSLSIYNILQRKLTKTYSALTTSAFSIFAGTLLLCVFLPVSVREVPKAPAIQMFYIVLLGIFPSALAYISWSKAFEKAKQTSQVSNYMFLTPFITSVLGYLIADEVPDQATIIGGAIIFAGVLVFYIGSRIEKDIGDNICDLKADA